MNGESSIRHKEYIKNLGYTIQSEICNTEGQVTYFVEQGNSYVMQIITLFNDLGYMNSMQERVLCLEQITETWPDLFLRYYEHQWMETFSEYEKDLLIRIEYGYNLERYQRGHSLTLNEILQLGIQIARAARICCSNSTIPLLIDEKSVFHMGKDNWRLGNFQLGRVREWSSTEEENALEESQGATADESQMVYQLGLLLYRLLNRMEMPFTDSCQNEQEAEQLRRTGKEFPLPPDGCDSLKKVVCRACSRKDKRYAQLEQLEKKLMRIQKALPKAWLETEIRGHSYQDEEYLEADFAQIQEAIWPLENQKEPELAEKGNPQKEQKRQEKERERQQEREERRRRNQYFQKKREKEKQQKRETRQQEQEKHRKSRRKKTVKRPGTGGDSQLSGMEIDDHFRKQNKKDLYRILGVVAGFILLVTVLIVTASGSKNRRIYSYIDSAAYGSAMKEMQLLHEKGKNLDKAVEYYLNACIEDREYKRIPEGVELLSETYCKQHKETFENMVVEMIDSGKEKRAAELISGMEKMGGCRSTYAKELEKKLE